VSLRRHRGGSSEEEKGGDPEEGREGEDVAGPVKGRTAPWGTAEQGTKLHKGAG